MATKFHVSCVISAYTSIYLQTGFGLGHEDLPFCPSEDHTCKDVVNGTLGVSMDTVTVPTVEEHRCGYYRRQRGLIVAGGQGSGVKRQWVKLEGDDCVLSGAKVVLTSLGCDDCWTQMR